MVNVKSYQELFLKYLDQSPWPESPKALYEPVDYLMHLGGKRLRPVLALIAYSLFRKDVERALPAAMAVEVFHNFSLVHDDIMDEAPLRRGKPSVHTKYNINTGILSGDVMLIYTYEYLLQIDDPEKIRKMVSVFNKVAIKVCEGQQYDMDFEQRSDVTIDEYIEMIRFKTAALIAGSLALGAIAAGAADEDVRHLEAFGENIGLAFQLQDDYLDTFGDPEKVGKKAGGDIAQNKKTFLILRALEVAGPEQRRELEKYMGSTDFDEQEKITAVMDILRSLDIPAQILSRKQFYQDEAFRHLNEVNTINQNTQILYDLSMDLIGRES
ncbi:polyprenyl synthetase family protein [Flavilitoribacter nigricans]|uniref:Polyprenyl synthetase n=1 Tax=Flavilitoribacter nigricans (strain ATCC 23147 / DSM 23189 / NBRC 102662 / NCIMB 1420 / SS-2) TaxID=1122177 RepID=A0A2D0MY87_FLAN2|nr:polyprenyl synthetase family protein [Flavilitoribacter nigricans]PHN01177.1 polyprenyl synthetase [Flavilitoribacter nigricans DSM 23189 = NBRC 102662]